MRPRVLETRRSGWRVRRRYRTAQGATFWTVEVPEPVFLGALRRDALARREASFARALATQETRAQAEALLRQGWKPIAVAAQMDLHVRTVERYRRELK